MNPARLIACFMLACVAAAPAWGAEAPQEIHGVADAYAGQGVAMAWAVLRGKDEAATTVVVRIAADPALYPRVAATGRNPFSQRAEPILPPTMHTGSIDLIVSRARFADLPRTELRFYGSAPDDAPRLTVYFLGVPDTTPEFASEATLSTYLADRIARLRAPGNRTQ